MKRLIIITALLAVITQADITVTNPCANITKDRQIYCLGEQIVQVEFFGYFMEV